MSLSFFWHVQELYFFRLVLPGETQVQIRFVCLCTGWGFLHTLCWLIQPIASWKLLEGSSHPELLPLVLLLRCMVPVMTMWTSFSWSLQTLTLQIHDMTSGKRFQVEEVKQRGLESHLPPDYVLIGMTQMVEFQRAALQLLDGIFGHPHVKLCFTRFAALQHVHTDVKTERLVCVWVCVRVTTKCLLNLF